LPVRWARSPHATLLGARLCGGAVFEDNYFFIGAMSKLKADFDRTLVWICPPFQTAVLLPCCTNSPTNYLRALIFQLGWDIDRAKGSFSSKTFVRVWMRMLGQGMPSLTSWRWTRFTPFPMSTHRKSCRHGNVLSRAIARHQVSPLAHAVVANFRRARLRTIAWKA